MSRRCEKSEWVFLILGILLVVLKSRSSALRQDPFCRQGIFKKSTETVDVNITKQVFVSSVLECAQLCRTENSCEVFKHRVGSHEGINCQVTQGKPEYLKISEKKAANERWNFYTLQIIESPKCVKDNSCNSAGQCLADSCEPEGFKCKCKDNYYGKYCQYEKDDYDIVFPDTPERSPIDLGRINVDFDEFTFTAWIKFNPGFTVYPLMSYTFQNLNETIALAFFADNSSRNRSIKSFSGNLFGNSIGTSTIPISDGYWHHVGFTWTGGTGEWMLLIDGVLWAHRNVLKGRKIPSGGNLNIGKVTHENVNYTLVGNVSRVNLWSEAKNGSEIELIAKSPGSKEGDLIAWFKVKDFVSHLRVIRPSNASFSGEGLNYEITLPLSSQVNYPGPTKPMTFLTSCLWVKDGGTGATQFFAYDTTNTFSFRYISRAKLSFTLNSYSGETSVSCSSWHFLCIQWNGGEGSVSLFYDGYKRGNSFKDTKLETELPAGKSFILGLGADSALLTQLNVWEYEITTTSFYPMSAGGFNIHGNIVSWGSLAKYLPGTKVAWNTAVYIPGFTVLGKRTKWCNSHHPNSACPGELLARFGGQKDGKGMFWRCYCPWSLAGAKYTYDINSASSNYHSWHKELLAINK